MNGIAELRQIADLCAAAGYGPDRVRLDPSVVRGLGYYTGPVFEAELTFEITDEKGRPRQFGSVAGGGRYDDLVKRFTGQEVPAVGVSIGVDRLLAALKAKGRIATDTRGPVVVTVMDRDRMADYQAMAATLRDAGIPAEVFLGNPKSFPKQLDYADKRNAPLTLIQGSSEQERGVVIIRDMALGALFAGRFASDFEDRDKWREIATGEPFQTECPADALLDGVNKILSRAAGGYSFNENNDIIGAGGEIVVPVSILER